MNEQCTICRDPVSRNEAVQRTDLRSVRAYHRSCFTIHRAVKDIPVDVVVDEVVGGSLLERMTRAGLR